MREAFVVLGLIPLIVGFIPLASEYRGVTPKELKSRIDKVSTKKASVVRAQEPIRKSSLHPVRKKSKILQELKRLKSLSKFSPSFGDQFGKIKTLERFKGIVEGNIKASSYGNAAFKVSIEQNEKFPEGSYLSCEGKVFAGKYNYKIISSCERLVTDEREYRVAVSLKDTNLTDGITADFIHTGGEEAVLGEAFTAGVAAIIDAKKERVLTSLGFAELPSVKNASLTGLFAAAGLANKKTKEENKLPYVLLAVEDQKEIVIEFREGFSYEKDSSI